MYDMTKRFKAMTKTTFWDVLIKIVIAIPGVRPEAREHKLFIYFTTIAFARPLSVRIV